MRLLAALLLILGLAVPAGAETLVRIEGKSFIAPDGATLHLKGISLGNWLMPEGYMFKFEVAKSPRQIYGAFDRLLGPERATRFWRQYRDTYVTEEDIRFIKSVGFNMVRVPLHWRLFEPRRPNARWSPPCCSTSSRLAWDWLRWKARQLRLC